MMMMMITGISDNKDYVINKRTHTLGDFFLHTVGVFSAHGVIFSAWGFFPGGFFPCGDFFRGDFFRGDFFRGDIFRGDFFPW